MSGPVFSPGTVIAGRFQIEQLVNSGGMGVVYRCRDRQAASDAAAIVALKLLRVDNGAAEHSDRFIREARLLSALHHPGIVSYVADGQLADGQRYLAMEWLDGEDLGRRLQRGPLAPQDTLILLERLADILSLTHSRGIIHRDLKPTNLFLPAGRLDQVKVLDFGIARVVDGGGMTQTGLIVGTPAYMAPEQARGLRDISPAADIYSLGCIVYECLTGQPPFWDNHAGSMLVRVLFEEPPPVETLCPGLPAWLVELLARMMAKAPEQRVRDGAALSAALRELRKQPDALAHLPAAPVQVTPAVEASWLSRTQQSLLSVVLAAPPLQLAESSQAETLSPEDLARLQAELRQIGTHVEPLVNGTLLASVADFGSAADQAGLAARAALTIKRAWPQAVVALSTGRGTYQAHEVVGDVVSRAARLSMQAWPSDWHVSPDRCVVADEVSSHLLADGFAQERHPAMFGVCLQPRDEQAGPAALAHPQSAAMTLSVGREVELSFLHSQLVRCTEDSKACVILITGAPGLGKSRLLHEFRARSRELGQPLSIFATQGELRDGGGPYSLVQRLLLSTLGTAIQPARGTSEKQPASSSRALLHERLMRWLPKDQREFTTTFLLQLFDPPAESTDRRVQALLAEARADQRRMHAHLSQAFVSWLAAECVHAPVLLILDDLQWGDPLSVGLIDAALRGLRDAPLFVLSLALPEIRKAFPKLWAGQPVQELPLKPLGRRACERLIRHVLGSDVNTEQLHRITECSAGNPFFLHELLHAQKSGQHEAAEQTIVAMLQARIGRLDEGPRRVLLAASIFGLQFQRSGLQMLLGIRPSDVQLDQDIASLIQSELIESHASRSDAAERVYGFRGPLLRHAAYQLLSVNALLVGHRMAARFLERSDHADPLRLAEHFQRGREPEKASLYFLRAAVQHARASTGEATFALFDEAKKQLAGLPDSASQKRLLIDILLHRIRFGLLSSHQPENLAYLDEAQMLLLGLEDLDEHDRSDDLRRAWIELLSGRLCLLEGRVSEALLYCRRALPVAEPLQDEALLATTEYTLSMALILQGRLREAQPHLSRTLCLLPQLDSEPSRVAAHGFSALSQLVQGSGHVGASNHAEIFSRMAAPEQPGLVVLAALFHVIALALAADSAAALQQALHVVPLAERLGVPLFLYPLHSVIGWAQAQQGEVDLALARHAAAQALAHEPGAGALFGDWLDALHADTLLRCGRAQQALHRIEKALPRWRQEQHQLALGLGEQTAGLAKSCLDPARTEAASAHVERARSLMKSHGQVLPAARLCLEWAQLCRRRGEHAQADALHAEAQVALGAAGWLHVIREIEKASLRLPWSQPSALPASSAASDKHPPS
ncbi:MAG: protein kinase [Myxococcales bacterium]|nr:protein kinase [Myxococcales bacterium]